MFRSLITVLAFTFTTSAFSQTFVENVDYMRLKSQQPTQVAKDKIEVIEVFQFGCIHCARMESVLTVWKKTKPAAVEFRSIHATFGDPVLQNLARAHLATLALGIAEKTQRSMFKDIESGRRPTAESTNLNVIAKNLVPFGVKPDVFVATANSFSVSQKLKQNEAILPRYEVGGTPEFIVAGKYRVSVLVGKPQERSLEVVDFLVQKELIERAAVKK